MRILGKYEEATYVLLRIVSGLMFMCHGAQKLFGVLGGQKVTTDKPLMMLGGVIEFFGGAMIAIGLLASLAAFIASGMMAVAYFMAHFPQNFWPILNKGELAVLYCFVFLYIAARGSGALSVDAARSGPRRA